ncbi:cartilage intermediate layer protein 1-like [Ptychodera flava]|uniref:cartilage intermediate layer protein 1-like n=1 Tax=Ptychodera flava TaxID=63121 RepID=UPI00396A61AA
MSCICDGDVVEGTVQDAYGKPIDDADIYRAEFPVDPIGGSDAKGKFALSGVCISEFALLVKKDQFMSVRVTETENRRKREAQNVTLNIKMQQLAPPVITRHPQSKVRLVGESVTLCCEASGVPSPSYYEWFKNNDVIDGFEESSLTMDNLQMSDAGSYKCRANSEAGAQYSEPASLTIYVAANDACSSDPLPHWLKLPAECVESSGYEYYNVETVKVLPLNEDFSSVYHAVSLARKSQPVTLKGNETSTIFLGNTSDENTKAELEIPEKSFYTEDGNLYTGEVKAAVNFYDPSDPSAVDVMPSDLNTRDIEGNTQQLQTYGMLSLQFQDDGGNHLRVDNPIVVYIDPVKAGIDLDDVDENGNLLTRLWKLDTLSGEWEDMGGLEVVSMKRRKRRTESFLIGNMTVRGYNLNYMNIDKVQDRRRTCYLNVRLFRDETLERTVEKASVTAVSADRSDSRRSGQLYYFQRAMTNTEGRVCLMTFCERNGELFNVHVNAEKDDEILKPIHPDNVPTNKHPADWPIDLKQSVILPSDDNGPQFASMKAITPQMSYENLFYDRWYDQYDYERIENQDHGPFYWQWRDRYSALRKCSEADSEENFMVFTYPEKGLEENTAADDEEEDDRSPLSWFPYEGSQKRACFIKIFVNSTDTGRFQVFSTGGEVPDVKDRLFGYRIDNSKKSADGSISAACIEFKCSGPIRIGDPKNNIASPPAPPDAGRTIGTDRTILRIVPRLPSNCQLKPGNNGVNPGLTTFLTINGIVDELSISGSDITFKVPDGNINGPTTGIYGFQGGRNKSYKSAYTNCLAGDDNAYSGGSIDAPDIGWAFQYECS